MNYGLRFMTLYRRHGSRPSPRKKNAKAKWSSEEALHTAVKRKEVKSKGEKERYKHLNAKFQKGQNESMILEIRMVIVLRE